MRKLTILLAAFIIITASCKKGSNNPDPEEPGTEVPKELPVEAPPLAESNALPMKAVMTNESGNTAIYTITYLPGSKKIDRITRPNGIVEIYHYTGDLIDRIDYGTQGSDYKKFEYENNALVRETQYRTSQPSSKSEYTYPSSNKLRTIEFKYKDSKWEQDGDPINLEFDGKGNLTKAESGKIKVGVSYDDKNTPFLNVTGWSKIHFVGGVPMGDNIDFEDVVARRNNPVKTTATDAGIPKLDLSFTYELNDTQNPKFPTKITGKDGTKTVFTVEICYSSDCSISDVPSDPNNAGNGGQPNPETASLPNAIVMTSNGETRTYTITYLENTAKIDKIASTDQRLEIYTYEGDLIKRKDNGTVTSEDYDAYSYVSGKLTKEEGYRGGKNTDIVELSYPGTKTQVVFKEFNNQAWEETFHILFNHDGKGNLIGAEITEDGKTAGEVSITYDTNNSPFMNVLGWGRIRFVSGAPLGDNVGFEDIMGARNNPVKLTGNMLGDNVEVTYTYEFEDSKNPKFPTKITGTKKVGTVNSIFTAEITYK